MRSIGAVISKLALLISVVAINAPADGLRLSKGGIGPIYVETELSYAGNGDHLKAHARNDSGRTIQHFKLCITADHGCLFTLWNTAPWKPDGVLDWDVDSPRRSKDLTHTVALTVIEAVPLPKPPKQARSGPSFLQALAIGLASAGSGPVPSVSSPAPAAQTELLLFGGDGHKVFLGCLNCSKFDGASVLNEFGQHGSKFSSESIFNQFGEYGSPYSTHSACNAYATDPPVIVDRSGNYYGRLTVNRYGDPTRLAYYAAWIAGVCQR
jgi:hypothetical protein